MNKKILAVGVGAFIVGAGCGFGAGKLYFEKKYKELSDQEIESVKEAFKNRKLPDKPDISTMVHQESETRSADEIIKEYEAVYNNGLIRDIPSFEETEDEESDENIKEYEEFELEDEYEEDEEPEEIVNVFEEASKNTITDEELFSKEDAPISVPKNPKDTIQYVTYEEFYNPRYDNYEKVDLTLYADGFLADENDEIIVDVTRSVGNEFMDHIGEFDQDTAYVRNTATRTDYEIIETRDTYSEATGNPIYADGYEYR